MTQVSTRLLALEGFLQLPETKPASELMQQQILQKPMPQGEHSLIQVELCKLIDRVAESQRIAKAFPELRCTFAGASIVPDVSVFRWQRIPRAASGKIANRFEIHPDWAIEILSPGRSQTRVLANLLHCSQNGTELGWLLDPADESVLAIFLESRVRLYQGTELLPTLSDLPLTLTAAEIFSWLSLPN